MSLMTFEEAEALTRNLEKFFNSEASDGVLMFLRDRFNLQFQPNFTFRINRVLRNHPACSGCHDGSCYMGCYFSHNGNVSYWDKALNRVLGYKLVMHEVAGHAVYEQIFMDGLDEEAHFNRSEEFAQYVERHFNQFMDFMNPELDVDEKIHKQTSGDSGFTGLVVNGIAIGAGVAIANILVKEGKKKFGKMKGN